MNLKIIKSRIKSIIKNFGGLAVVDVSTWENIDKNFKNKYKECVNEGELLLVTKYDKSNILIITSKKLIIYNDTVITDIMLESITDISIYIDQFKTKKDKLNLNSIQVLYGTKNIIMLKIKKKNTFFSVLNILKMIHNVTTK